MDKCFIPMKQVDVYVYNVTASNLQFEHIDYLVRTYSIFSHTLFTLSVLIWLIYDQTINRVFLLLPQLSANVKDDFIVASRKLCVSVKPFGSGVSK